MDYQVLELIIPYLDKKESLFQALVCKEWLQMIKQESFATPYSVIRSPSLLCYSNKFLNLVCTEKIKRNIIINGTLDTIKCLELYHSKYLSCFQSLETKQFKEKYLNYATQSGNLETMKWLFKNGCHFTSNTFNYAAENGNLESMKWLKDNGCEFTAFTFNSAVRNGSLENMKWLLENGCPFDCWTFNYAAENGNLENMKWLKSKGCGFGDYTFMYVAQHGNRENMKWLLENGCPN